MAWVHKIRLRLIVFVIGIPLAAFGAISLGPAWMALPIVGVAVAAMTMTVSKLTQRLGEGVCLTCGQSIRDIPPLEHGVVCPSCGSLNQHRPGMVASAEPMRGGDGGSARA
ncbi:MAG: hypothetical protein SFZ24_05705 [Planctomycetota bacterium]|nr:hypothetical protein [Planctomycetota bacterium]